MIDRTFGARKDSTYQRLLTIHGGIAIFAAGSKLIAGGISLVEDDDEAAARTGQEAYRFVVTL